MKRFTFILLAILSLSLLISCNNTEPQQEAAPKNPACAEIAADIIESFSVNTDDFDSFSFADESARLDEATISLFTATLRTTATRIFRT